MLHNIVAALQTVVSALKLNLHFMLTVLAVLWAVQTFNFLVKYRLNVLGLYPRSLHGLFGILFTPFLHGSFSHLLLNSVPLFILGSFLLLGGHPLFYCVSTIIVVLGGLLVWLFGRKAIHIGASGVVMGYMGYLLVQAYQSPSVLTIVIALTCIFYFGAMLLSVFPGAVRESWEGHLFGLLAGLAAVYLAPNMIHYFR